MEKITPSPSSLPSSQTQHSISKPDNARSRLVEDIQTQDVIHVSDYGAFPNDGVDDQQAILNAIEYAKALGNTTIVFDSGDYLLSSHQSLLIDEADGVILQGQGKEGQMRTQLIKDNIESALIKIDDSVNVFFKDMSFSLTFKPYSVSEVLEVSDNSIIVNNIDGLSPNDEKIENSSRNYGYFHNQWNQIAYNTDITYGVSSVEQLGNDKFKIHFQDKLNTNAITPGLKFIRNARNNGVSIFRILNSDKVKLENLDMSRSSAGGMFSSHSGAVSIVNCSSTFSDENRFQTLNADGVHFKGNTEGPHIDGCKMEGIGDDNINVSHLTILISEIGVNNKAFSLIDLSGNENALVTQKFKVVDEVAFFDHKGVKTPETAYLTMVEDNYIEVDRPVDSARLNSSEHPTSVINLSFRGATIINNELSASRRHAGVVRYSDAILSGNKIINNGDSGFVFANENGVDSAFTEGFVPSNVRIENNHFKNNGRSEKFNKLNHHADLSIYTSGEKNPVAHKNIQIAENYTIEGNVFDDWRQHAIYASNVNNLVINNNLMTHSMGDNTNEPIVVENSVNYDIS